MENNEAPNENSPDSSENEEEDCPVCGPFECECEDDSDDGEVK